MMSSGAERLVANQLPQPSRPPNSYDPSFQQTADMQMRFQVQGVRRHDDHVVAGEGRVRDRLKSEVEGILEKLENKGGSQDNKDLVQSRAIDNEPSSPKIERFKVRTVVAEEVVKEEDDK